MDSPVDAVVKRRRGNNFSANVRELVSLPFNNQIWPFDGKIDYTIKMDEFVPINGLLNKGNFDHYEDKNDCRLKVSVRLNYFDCKD